MLNQSHPWFLFENVTPWNLSGNLSDFVLGHCWVAEIRWGDDAMLRQLCTEQWVVPLQFLILSSDHLNIQRQSLIVFQTFSKALIRWTQFHNIFTCLCKDPTLALQHKPHHMHTSFHQYFNFWTTNLFLLASSPTSSTHIAGKHSKIKFTYTTVIYIFITIFCRILCLKLSEGIHVLACTENSSIWRKEFMLHVYSKKFTDTAAFIRNTKHIVNWSWSLYVCFIFRSLDF